MRIKVLILLILLSFSVFAQEKANPLFQSDEILHLRISTDIMITINDRQERNEHEGKLYYTGGDGNEQELDVKLMVRGMTRANPKICKFPPLRVNFKKKQVTGTLFDGQDKLKLVTHCNSRPINEQYVLREFYVYKLHQLTTDFSFKVRLCKITYEDTQGKFDSTPHYAFLIEEQKDLAKRNNMKSFKGKIMNQSACQQDELDKLMFFQFLVGNLDWSIPKRHNFKMIIGEAYPLPVAVPYDFDYSGIVNTTYAKPPTEIDIPTVRTRVFRGFCKEVGGYDPTIELYKELKPEIYALYTNSTYLSEKSIDQTVKYLDSFYKILETPKLLEREILKACPVPHKHTFDK